MKKIIFLVLVSIQALATTEYVSGSGYSSGFCRGDGFATFCVNQLKDRAQSDSQRDADLQCRLKRGNLVSYTASCFTNCNPAFIPSNQDAYVSCNSRCTYNCDIPNTGAE